VFKEFEQADGGLYTRRYGGMGLGLAICRQFTELLQGKIWAESIVDQGSMFHFEIPIEVIQNDASPEKMAAIILPKKTTSSHARVLSVEDNPIAQKMMVFMLTNLGYKPDTAITAQETLEKLSNNTYDIVFMDIQLPDGSGDKITKAIREGDGPNKNTTIIALTAHVYPNEKAIFLEAGMNKVMEKPMAKESLAEEIEEVMKRVN
jgi:CheY-like chemotaxis protein